MVATVDLMALDFQIGCWLMGPFDPFEWHGKTMEKPIDFP
jgi:hypothetical protein